MAMDDPDSDESELSDEDAAPFTAATVKLEAQVR